MTADLSRLTATERQVLLMLSAGHTAKSIAAETGLSVYAVNDRLREARRKAGVGSSRELARLLSQQRRNADGLVQEIWADKLGVAANPGGGRSELPDRMPDRPAVGRGTMIVSFSALAVAGAALVTAAQRDGAPARPPQVVSTYPTQGARIPPGHFMLRVTFDRPMRPDSYSFTGDPASMPLCASKPDVSADGRTFALSCRGAPGRSYVMGFNGGSFHNFVGADTCLPAASAQLRFSTR